MHENLSDKRGAKFLATTLRYGMLKIARLGDAFSEIFKLEASPVEGQSLLQKDKKRSKRKGEKKINKNHEKPENVSRFLKILISAHGRTKTS